MKLKTWLFFLYVILLLGCSSDNSTSPRSMNAEFEEDALHEGLIRVQSDRAFVVLGAKSGSFRISEYPKMSVRFDYNYSLGKHEVTYDEFSQFATDEWGKFSTVVSGSHPIADVSFYDAILYANARSKAEGYDTAYTYSKAIFDEDGHCNEMEGYAFHPEVDAYRLPTEAEWMLAATKDWDLDKAWLVENSDGIQHPVCSLGENSAGFCDLAGNLMEWMNDWQGFFTDSLVYNYAGAPDGGLNGERVLKGGSFRSSRESTNYISRGDVYTVTSATRAYYVGFRIAFGKIPDATWLNGVVAQSNNRILSMVSGQTIRSKTRTLRTKVAFRNEVTGNIGFVDYAIAPNSVFEIQDTLNCYHPDISPDGVWVAFSTGMEGIDTESSVYVRMLTIAGDSLMKLDVKNASIPRWRIQGNDTMIVYVTSSGNNKDEGSFKSNSTWQVPFRGLKFGTPEKLFDGAYHGGVSYDNRLAVTGARLLRARIANGDSSTVMDDSAQDTLWYGGEQACNVSLAADSTKRTLFLDFGGQTGRDFVGSSYQAHEKLFIMDSTGKLIQSVSAPKGYAFDHSEWALGGYYQNKLYERNFIISSLTNANGNHEKIVLIDLRDTSSLVLVTGTEIWHPCFWSYSASVPTGPTFDHVDLDSAAIYFEKTDDPLISNKMNLFWAKGDYMKTVGLGSSRMSQGFVANKMKSGATMNLAVIPSDMHVSYYMAMNYVLNHCKKLKYLVIGLDLDLWSAKEGDNLKKNILNIPGFHYDAHHDFWRNQDVNALKVLSRSYISESQNLRQFSLQMGWVENKTKNGWDKGGFGVAIMESDSIWSDKSDTYESSMAELQEIVERAGEKGVTVIGVIFPQSPGYASTGAFGRHGMRRSHAQKIIDRLEKMEDTYDNFRLMDENKMGNHDYPDSTAFDFDHLNAYGGLIISSRIDSLILKIDEEKKK